MTKSPNILIVDDNARAISIIEPLLKERGFHLLSAHDGIEALNTLEKNDIDLVLLDVVMPRMNGFEVCEKIKKNPKCQLIPVVLMSGLHHEDHRIRGIEVGADDFLTKPFNFKELLSRMRALLRTKSLTDGMDSAENVLQTLVQAVEARDPYTRHHAERVGLISVDLGKLMRLPPEDVKNLGMAGPIHDIGKIGIPDNIVNKNGKLTPEEFEFVKTHSMIGYQICKNLHSTKELLDLILHHHEKLDGSGYPDGLKGDDISLTVRIIMVADIFDALTSDRPYRKSMPVSRALNILRDEVKAHRVDGDVVNWLECLANNESLIDPLLTGKG